jgi:hypothetical protein
MILDQLRADGAPDGVASRGARVLLASLQRRSLGPTTAPTAARAGVALRGRERRGQDDHDRQAGPASVDAGRSVVLAAGDTFRAAAAEQLEQWAQRTGADIVRAGRGGRPRLGRARRARARQRARRRHRARRHRRTTLEQHEPARRTEQGPPRRRPRAGPGRRDLHGARRHDRAERAGQAREFLAAADVTGIVLTKLDGTARGGIVVAIERELGIPVKFVGSARAWRTSSSSNPRPSSIRCSTPDGSLEHMFDALSERLDRLGTSLRSRGRLSDADLDEALGEVRSALLEADVELGVVRAFLDAVRERLSGEALSQSLSPGQQVIKAVQEQLVEVLGGTPLKVTYASRPHGRAAGRSPGRRQDDDRGQAGRVVQAAGPPALPHRGRPPASGGGRAAARARRPDRRRRLQRGERSRRGRQEGREGGDASRARRGDHRHRRSPGDRRGA